MQPEKKEDIQRFLNDARLKNTIYGVLLRSFLKPQKDKDVHTLAAARIAIDLLEDAWKDLLNYRKEDVKEEKVVSNFAL